MNFDQIQSLIMNHQPGRGDVRLPDEDHDIGDNTILIPSQINLIGTGSALRGTNKKGLAGFGVAKGSAGHQGGTIRGFEMFNPNGPGVVVHDSATSIADIGMSDLFVQTKEASVLLNRVECIGVYLDRIRQNQGGVNFDITANELHIDRCQGGRILINSNFGTLTNSQIHSGTQGIPQLVIKGYDQYAKFRVDVWAETIGGMLFDSVQVKTDFANYRAQPKQPVRLANGARLDIAADLPWQDDFGGHPQRADYKDSRGRLSESKYLAAVKSLQAQCYQVDGTSSVYAAGDLVVGAK